MGFDHDGFTHLRAARRRVAPCRRPSAPFGWESLHRNAACSDALDVTRCCTGRASTFSRAHSPRRNEELLAPRQAPPRHAPVGRVLRRHQSAFDWLDPASRQDDRDTVRNRTCVTDRAPFSRATTCPPGQGRWASTVTLSSRPPTARIAQRANSKRHLVTESLQPTSFQVHPM